MASVTIKRGTEAEVASTAITDGQILFTTDREYNNQIMADVGENRILIGGNNVFTGTQAEYEEALSQGLIFEGMQVNITDDYDRDLDADVIVYDNTTSGLESTTVQGAIDEIDSNVDTLDGRVDTLDGRMDSAETKVGNSYKTTDTSDTTIASADKIPFYDESATSKKNIALDDFVDAIAPNFGSQVSISQGNTLDLLDKDGSPLDSVTIQTTANNVSYTDTNSIGATKVQSAIDTVGTLLKGRCKFVNVILRNGDTYSWSLTGNQLSLVVLIENTTSYNVTAISGIYSGVVVPLLQGSISPATVTQTTSSNVQTCTISATRTCVATVLIASE